jgi:hypothetical protein
MRRNSIINRLHIVLIVLLVGAGSCRHAEACSDANHKDRSTFDIFCSINTSNHSAIIPEINRELAFIENFHLMATPNQNVRRNIDQTGAVMVRDLLQTDINGKNPKTIESVTRSPGDSVIFMAITAPPVVSDKITPSGDEPFGMRL